MEKIKNHELKLKFFEETRCIFNPDIERGMVTESYIEWLEAKAKAYDRLMSGGLSMKEFTT